jgi:sigma-E factor negative regulatory protein RseA
MEDHMLTNSEQQAALRERLSALADGELDGSAVAQACGQWRESAEAQTAWHAYQLIGDVLRSDDLASDPARDADFLNAFRARMATEPVVLAPQPLESPPVVAQPSAARAANGAASRRWSWIAPSAVAAGFVAVAGVVMLTRTPTALPDARPDGGMAQVAPVRGGPQLANASTQAPSFATEPQTLVANGQLIRDARLDRYLDAHKQFAGSSALGVPSGFLRSATTVSASDR